SPPKRMGMAILLSPKSPIMLPEMESFKSDADNMTFNGNLNAATSSTPIDMPRYESSSESKDGSIHTHIQAAFELREYVCAGFIARAPYLNINLHKMSIRTGKKFQIVVSIIMLVSSESGPSAKTLAPFARGECRLRAFLP
ncbi:hypothetical protein HAX54_032578, partial [Datura stramonium]|nr:hypothetical protein [Datura stramonium]